MKYPVWEHPNSIRTQFKVGQRNPEVAIRNKRSEIRKKISETRKRLFAEGKLTSLFQTDKNPSKLGIPNKGQFKRGQKPWNYLGGRTFHGIPEEKWIKLRIKVWQRDRFTCQGCGVKGVLIDTHHIIPYRISHDNSMKNLITLCRNCHAKADNTIIKNRLKRGKKNRNN